MAVSVRAHFPDLEIEDGASSIRKKAGCPRKTNSTFSKRVRLRSLTWYLSMAGSHCQTGGRSLVHAAVSVIGWLNSLSLSTIVVDRVFPQTVFNSHNPPSLLHESDKDLSTVLRALRQIETTKQLQCHVWFRLLLLLQTDDYFCDGAHVFCVHAILK